MTNIDWPPIWFSTIAWKDIGDKAFLVKPLEQQLNDALVLKDYGAGLHALSFIVIAVLPSNRIHQEGIKFYPRKKALEIRLKLDYAAAAAADETAFQQLVAQLFLRGIDEAPQSRIRDFDWARFRRDVERVLGGGQL
jgi:hypothetical protein